MVAIFVVATVLVCLTIELLRQHAAERKAALAPIRPQTVPERFLLPRGFFIGRGHSWVELMFSGHARVGVDDFTQKVIGKVDRVEVAPLNTNVKKGDVIARLAHGGRTLSITAPISGRILHVNEDLLHAPELIRKDPYVSGWLLEIIPDNVGPELKSLSIADEAAQWLRQEIARFRDFVQAQISTGAPMPAGATLLDGGVPLNGVLEQFNEKTWQAFEQEFLAAKG